MNYTKQEARAIAKKARAELEESVVFRNSRKIFNTLLSFDVYQNCETILVYMAYNKEVETWEFIEHCLNEGKRVALPRVDQRKKMCMNFYYIHGKAELSHGAYGILEPMGNECCIPDDKTIMILPGVAFDSCCHRVGYGGGYYDSYLEKYPELVKIGVCHEVQLFEYIQIEAHDIIPDILITEEQTFYKASCI